MKQNKDRLDWHGTTIVLIKKGNDVVVAGDVSNSINLDRGSLCSPFFITMV